MLIGPARTEEERVVKKSMPESDLELKAGEYRTVPFSAAGKKWLHLHQNASRHSFEI